MTDPLRRDPREFLRLLKKMSQTTSWQKTLLTASKARMVGYSLELPHYNAILFSQSLWGRALEISQVIQAMEYDGVKPNGVSYYYICNGMANADHGYNYDFPVNRMLPGVQHWRIALNALQACESNGFDATDTMHNACMAACTIPSGPDKWQHALQLVHKMVSEERKLHPQSVSFLERSLIRSQRPNETSALLRLAAERRVKGYEDRWEPDIYQQKSLNLSEYDRNDTVPLPHRPESLEKRLLKSVNNHEWTGLDKLDIRRRKRLRASLERAMNFQHHDAKTRSQPAFQSKFSRLNTHQIDPIPFTTNSSSHSSTSKEVRERTSHLLCSLIARKPTQIPFAPGSAYSVDPYGFLQVKGQWGSHEELLDATGSREDLTHAEELRQNESDTIHPLEGYGIPRDASEVFRPRVYRQLWYKWHAIANRYRPTASLRKRQLAPRNSPSGIPGFYRL